MPFFYKIFQVFDKTVRIWSRNSSLPRKEETKNEESEKKRHEWITEKRVETEREARERSQKQRVRREKREKRKEKSLKSE